MHSHSDTMSKEFQNKPADRRTLRFLSTVSISKFYLNGDGSVWPQPQGCKKCKIERLLSSTVLEYKYHESLDLSNNYMAGALHSKNVSSKLRTCKSHKASHSLRLWLGLPRIKSFFHYHRAAGLETATSTVLDQQFMTNHGLRPMLFSWLQMAKFRHQFD